MDRKLLFSHPQQRGFVHLITALIGLVLLVALAFSLNALFASRNTPTTGQPSPINSRLVSPPSSIDSSQAGPMTGWRLYNNEKYSLTIKYPSRLSIEELMADDELRSGSGASLAVRFFSPEAAPEAAVPLGREAAQQFAVQYTHIYLQVYDNDLDLSLIEALKQIYSKRATVSQTTVFDVVGPKLHVSDFGPPGTLVFEGNVGENPQKSVFFSHKGLIYSITLHGGPDTGSPYSDTAEDVFNLMVSSVELH